MGKRPAKRGAITWAQLKRACRKHNPPVEILKGPGSERKLRGFDSTGKITVMRIGHKCCSSPTDVVYIDYVLNIRRRFGITDEELANA